MQSGRIRSRRQNTMVVGVVSMTILMTVEEFNVFKVFVRDGLGRGSAEFAMPVWDGTGCPVRTCRIRNGGRYGYAKSGAAFRVTLELDVRGL